mgnify:CR=1 FL=1
MPRSLIRRSRHCVSSGTFLRISFARIATDGRIDDERTHRLDATAVSKENAESPLFDRFFAEALLAQTVGCRARSSSNMPNAHALNGYEIMAPAGALDAVAAALAGGADSVYFGAGALNMRSRTASSITLEDLPEIVSRCSDKGAKAYLTLNSIVYEGELPLMEHMLDRAAEAGISAVIAADPAAIAAARERGIEVHLSTQLSISNARALSLCAVCRRRCSCARADARRNQGHSRDDRTGKHLRPERRARSHRVLLSRRPLHGRERALQFELLFAGQKRQPRRVPAYLPSQVSARRHRARRGDRL